MQITIWERVPKDGRYYWMRNKEQYLHTLSKGNRSWVELLVNVHYTVQIHPS
jgi:hypothetical protein